MSAEAKKVSLNKKDVQKAAVWWHATSHMTYNYQRLQAGSFASMMGPILEKLYPGSKEKMSEGLERHMLYFNTEPRFGAVIPGVAVALEEGAANDENIDPELITEVKTAMMGPLAGIGDTLWAGLIKPIILSIILSWALAGNIWGAWAYGIGVTILDFAVTYFTFMQGYRLGTESIDRILEGGVIKKVTTFLGIVGLFALGAMVVNFVNIDAVLQIELETGTIHLGETLNMIVPQLLPLLFTLLVFWLLRKGRKPTFALFVLFIIGFIGGALGLIG